MSILASFIKNQFDAAWNAHDLERVMQHFADDAVVRMEPPPPGAPPVFRGKQEIRLFAQMLLPGFHVDSRLFAEDGDRVGWFSTVSNDGFRQLGLESVDCTCEAVVRGGKVTSFAPTFTPSAVARIQAAQNKAVARRFFDEVINAGDVDLVDELCVADLIEHEEFPGLQPGREGLKQFVNMFRSAFPDTRWVAEDMVAEGDEVVCRIRMQGTHQGRFLDLPPTGRRIDVSGIDILRFEGGKAVEHWGVTDAMTMMQQLGALPEGDGAPQPSGDGALAQAEPGGAALIRSFYEAYNSRDFDYAAGCTRADAELINVATGETFHGPEGTRTFLQGWASAFPDSMVEVLNLVTSADQVVAEFIGRGTNTGPLMTPAGETPPTGRAVEVRFCDVWRLQDGKIVENRSYFDLATMMRQLGLLSEDASAGAGG